MGVRVLMVVSMISLWFVISPSSSYACSCAPPGTPEEKLARSALVFRGTVTSIELNWQRGWLSVSFDVAMVWKGPDAQALTMFTPEDSAACGVPFEVGVEYVVYSFDGLDIGRCGRTAPVELAGEDLAAFSGGAQVSPETDFPNTGSGGLAAESQSGFGLLEASLALGLLLVMAIGATWMARRRQGHVPRR